MLADLVDGPSCHLEVALGVIFEYFYFIWYSKGEGLTKLQNAILLLNLHACGPGRWAFVSSRGSILFIVQIVNASPNCIL